MNNRRRQYRRAVRDIEAAFVHVARAAQLLQYVDDWVEHCTGQPLARVWDRVADAQCVLQELLEDGRLDDARKGKRSKQ